MDSIDVIWKSYHEPEIIPRGYWDQAMLEEWFAGMNHRTEFGNCEDGAIVVLNGRTHTSEWDLQTFNSDLAALPWALVLITGDEEGTFPWWEVKHPYMKLWVMSPRQGVHDGLSFLPNGYRPYTKALLREIGPQERIIDFFFAGQVNHDRRTACENAAVPLLDNHKAYFVPTEHFGEEKISYPEYLTLLGRTKVALCPSGNYCPDTFRVWEALEAGCIPVVDAISTCYREPGFWGYLLGSHPFPVVNEWSELPALLEKLLENHGRIAANIHEWWVGYKNEIRRQLEKDVEQLWIP